MRGTDSTARFAVAVISVVLVWRRKRWTPRVARRVVTAGALFALWHSGGTAMQPGVIAFVGALIVIFLGRNSSQAERTAKSSRTSAACAAGSFTS